MSRTVVQRSITAPGNAFAKTAPLHCGHYMGVHIVKAILEDRFAVR